jgi:hypothetical protein
VAQYVQALRDTDAMSAGRTLSEPVVIDLRMPE